ncbi:type III-B CRISPR-associated protein Cas10/Cmr2 [Nodosilinea sp. LEGE 07088]|uniref:type III-B CRISPR-associated protein Cas10/Cmr2 n=1 Tax=Nodosilinea sp. LEGE 07088 TaxID=2777968 RepID=UPI001881A448|nr:type III-B CRISPR-associated protein Cas10/Cmr2 [Nodosilinea sp. LEGE 07088]MBE9138187.1 type III-B CRISPR-associated protein Cas10/Cmr2 [Nodosilinea sp. LEGE 07088]
MTDYQRKLYAFLQAFHHFKDPDVEHHLCATLQCLAPQLADLRDWWRAGGNLCLDVAASSDRLNLQTTPELPNEVGVRHPISGQQQIITELPLEPVEIPADIQTSPDAKHVFWWFWRFYPEYWAKANPDSQALLYPAHRILPDCPLHSYQSTVSALAGAMYPEGHNGDRPETPYLLLFSFSPVQEFIKASRKFVDFWAGSYLLHYLSARLCWHIAQTYGPDVVIVPSLWNQEIFDALMLQDGDFSSFEAFFREIAPEASAHQTPVERFNHKESNSLSTAGFPNMITVLVPGEKGARQLGQELTEELVEEWKTIGNKVQGQIRDRVISWLSSQSSGALQTLLQEAFPDLNLQDNEALKPYWREIEKLQDPCAWHWPNLWEQQLSHSWEPYWAAVPLGSPNAAVEVTLSDPQATDWIQAQRAIAFSPEGLNIPSPEEKQLYESLENGRLNIGNWWGPLQQRLIVCLHAVKNTRNWQIPAAPGGRSTLSGQFSAVHPWLKYHGSFREGGGLPESSMRLFWLVMSKAYVGLFNGSERLNALELTKRMAWQHGGIAETLGVSDEWDDANPDYENLIRFPNLSSIAAARYLKTVPDQARDYWHRLKRLIEGEQEQKFSSDEKQVFYSRTKRPCQIFQTDAALQVTLHNDPEFRNGLNGLMYSSRWLADDMGLQTPEAIGKLRQLVDKAHQKGDDFSGFGQGSPDDWWVILLSDGDSMGQYVSGKKLGVYEKYLVEDVITPGIDSDLLQAFQAETHKRMGPATHVGLNRALLDFSNHLVPHLTEQRYCGRVIYSGGDDVMAVLPLEDIPEYLLSLRAAWCGGQDPCGDFSSNDSGYWNPQKPLKGIQKRPYFTMGAEATMSSGVVFAHKSVPLPTVLESLWTAEGDRAKAMHYKNGICFRVIYGSGNQLEALMHGELLKTWWDWVRKYPGYRKRLSPLLYRLAEELPRRIGELPEHPHLFSKAAKVLMSQRDENRQLEVFSAIEDWLDDWEDWARSAQSEARQAALNQGKSAEQATEIAKSTLGTRPEDLGKLLRFTAFWIDKRVERYQWTHGEED